MNQSNHIYVYEYTPHTHHETYVYTPLIFFKIFRANSGIGFELATYAAAKGAKLYMLCRTMERAEKAREDIIRSTKNDNIKIIQVSSVVTTYKLFLFIVVYCCCFSFEFTVFMFSFVLYCLEIKSFIHSIDRMNSWNGMQKIVINDNVH